MRFFRLNSSSVYLKMIVESADWKVATALNCLCSRHVQTAINTGHRSILRSRWISGSPGKGSPGKVHQLDMKTTLPYVDLVFMSKCILSTFWSHWIVILILFSCWFFFFFLCEGLFWCFFGFGKTLHRTTGGNRTGHTACMVEPPSCLVIWGCFYWVKKRFSWYWGSCGLHRSEALSLHMLCNRMQDVVPEGSSEKKAVSLQ